MLLFGCVMEARGVCSLGCSSQMVCGTGGTLLNCHGYLWCVQVPLLLLWGMKDPWITPSRAEKVRSLYPSAEFVPLPNAGHCPHDDTPAEANAALLEWLAKV